MWCFKKRKKGLKTKELLLSYMETLIDNNVRLIEIVFEKMLGDKYMLYFNEGCFYITEKDKKGDFVIRGVLGKLIYQTKSIEELNGFVEGLKFLSSKIYKGK